MQKKISLLIVCMMLATSFSGLFYVKMSVAEPTTIYVDDDNTAKPIWQFTTVSDTIPPIISNITLLASEPLDTDPSFGWINITCDVTDNLNVSDVRLNITCPDGSTTNVSMNAPEGQNYYYNTTFTQYGIYHYFIWASDTYGNTCISSSYEFTMPPNWDINSDGECNLLDLILISIHYGKTGSSGWLREDVDNNGVITTLDVVLVSNHIGEQWLPPPYAPSTPSPPDNATGVDIATNLSWAGGDPDGDSVTYDVYFGTASSPPKVISNQSITSYNPGTMSYSTTYYWKIVAWDSHGTTTPGLIWHFTTVNNPPVFGTPSPANGSIGNSLSFTWSIPINDPEGDMFSWTIQCSNSQTNGNTGVTNGTKSLTLSGLAYSTTYKVWVNATDPTGSGLYTRKWYTFTTKQNTPPSKPERPSGLASGKINVEYTYTTKTVDCNGDQVYYWWDWGNGSNSGWLGPYISNVTASATHTWTVKGSYNIKVKSKDTSGAESPWSDPLPITMPLDVESGNSLLLKQVNQSPNATPLLRHLMG